MSLTLTTLFEHIVRRYPDHTAQLIKDAEGTFQPRSWSELLHLVDRCAAGLIHVGVERGDRVGLLSENRAEWFVADLAVLSLGAADVPRGVDATIDEVRFIYSFSQTKVIFAETARQVQMLADMVGELPDLETIIVLAASESLPEAGRVQVLTLDELLKRGDPLLEAEPNRIDAERAVGTDEDVATLIFTSGTTGEPKGVMLSHRNLMHQVEQVPQLIDVNEDDIWLCVLPVWHSFERIMQYVAMGRGSALAYSKPIGQVMLADFQKVRPSWMASVPRIWEAIRAGIYRNVAKQSAVKQRIFSTFVSIGATWAHFRDMLMGRLPRFRRRVRILDSLIALVPFLLLTPLNALGNVLVFKTIQARLGGRFKAGISGGGALPAHVDRFFSAAGILLLEGYGLTETAPVLAVRSQSHPVAGTVGPVFPGTEVRIVGEAGETLPPGTQGVVHARGPQVMKGYYRRPELTAAILDADGWINTGDLGMLTWDNDLKITGRAKDTVVLLGGENIEPAPIEEKLRASAYIAQAVVLGQDQKFLAALIVPDFEALDAWAAEQEISAADRAALVADTRVVRLYNDEIRGLVNAQNGFKAFEQIARFELLSSDFQVGEELSAKQEIKRHVINERYAESIRRLFL